MNRFRLKQKNSLVKTPPEQEKIIEGGQILARILADLCALVQPGVSTAELNQHAYNAILAAGGRPSFLGYGPKKNPFPGSLCTSVNDIVVHGIPHAKHVLKSGDIVGLDVGMEYKGLFTDHARTVAVEPVNDAINTLLKQTQLALEAGIAAAVTGNTTGDIGAAIEAVAQKNNYGIVQELIGHGVGYAVHEDPQVPNYGKPGSGVTLKPGMVLAIEPMFNLGTREIYFDRDGWSVRTVDGLPSAHFEHTVIIQDSGPAIIATVFE